MNSKCIDCGKELSTSHYKRCQKHHLIYLVEINKKREHKPLSEETKRKIGLAGIGRKKSPETIEKLRQKLLGRKFTEEHKKKLSLVAKQQYLDGRIPWRVGTHLSEETKAKIRKARLGKPHSSSTKFKKGLIPWNKGTKGVQIGGFKKGNSFWKGKKFSKKHKKRLSEVFTGKKKPPLTEEHKSKLRKYWENKEWVEKTLKAQLKALIKRPTSLEKQMIGIIKKHKLPYEYTGDGSFIIGGKNPDFVNIGGEKKLIEVGNEYHHQGNYIEKRREHFSRYGWKSYIFITNKLNEDEIIKTLSI